MNAVFTLDLDGAEETVLVRDVQRDPIKRVVTHADFLRIDPNQKIRLSIPIELVGEAKEVIEAGGLIEQAMYEIEVEVSPDLIPESIQADLSTLTLDSRIAVSDLVFPAGVVPLVEEAISVVVPVVSRAAKMADGEDEDGELTEADEAEASDDADSADEEE
jgi:large subunit ribosomal protein L25